MEKIKTVLIDDEPYAIEILRDYILEVDELEILKTFTDPLEAVSDDALKEADVIFTDIKMPKVDGFALLRALKPQALVVFTTAFDQHAVHSFQFNTIDYLVKPIAFDRFLVTVDKLKRHHSMQPEDLTHKNETIIIKSSGIKHHVALNDIRYLKAEEDYIEYCLRDKKILELIPLKQKVEELKSFSFIRIHRSYAIRMSNVTRIGPNKLETVYGDQLPIGRSYKREVHALFESLNSLT